MNILPPKISHNVPENGFYKVVDSEGIFGYKDGKLICRF